MNILFRPLETEVEAKQGFQIICAAFKMHYEEDHYLNRQKDGLFYGLFISNKLSSVVLLHPKGDGTVYGLDSLARTKESKGQIIEEQSVGRLTVIKSCEHLLQKSRKTRFLELFCRGNIHRRYYYELGFRDIPHNLPENFHAMTKQLR
jgi:hypothetical protein